MFVLIRGAGDIATGIALRLWRSGMQVAMLDLPNPTAIRRTVCFSPALRFGTQEEGRGCDGQEGSIDGAGAGNSGPGLYSCSGGPGRGEHPYFEAGCAGGCHSG